jgi:ubiquinone/menaquinone biosynthesis C-methylase UbiE
MSIDVSAVKQGQRRMWAAGDYHEVSRTIQAAADVLVERVGAGPGVELLDVATGTGNVAVPAAEAGARVTGLDLTAELLHVARARAEQAGVDVHFVEGDAEELPFENDSFDRVSSCFGVMFAPRHEQAAAELVRVARPGATIGVTAWTPEGLNGRMFTTLGSYMPAPPAGLKPLVSWGTEEHVRDLFAGTGAELSFERRTVTFTHDSPESWMEYHESTLGPAIMAKAALESEGRYGELRAELIGLYSAANEAHDGSFRAEAEYLLTLARLPG